MPVECSECGRPFAFPSRLVAHVKQCHSQEKPFECSSCSQRFKTQFSCTRHEGTVHKKQEQRFHCRACGKGYDDQRHLRAHFAAHEQEESVAAPRVLKFWAEQWTKSQQELQRLRAKGNCSPAHCQVPVRERDTAFACSDCKRYWHWGCVGYEASLSALPVLVCPQCLTSNNRSVLTCAIALANRQLLEAQVHGVVHKTPMDGWCLIECVAQATQRERTPLLQAAADQLLTMLPELPISDEEKLEVQRECQRCLGGRPQLGKQWDSKLLDHLPQALSQVVQRPLHILQVLDAKIKMTVVNPASSQADPIVLLRSYVELGHDHYDLVA